MPCNMKQTSENIEVKIGRLDEKVSFVLQELKDLKDGTYNDIALLKKDKVDRIEYDLLQRKVNEDVESRVRVLETYKSTYLTMTIIYAGIGGTMIALILYHLLQK